jgi:hypothetical protein
VRASQALLVSAGVRELLSDADLERLAAMAASGYRCSSCGQRGMLSDGPASVLVTLQDGPGDTGRIAVAGLAHGRCCPPQVIDRPGILQVPAEAGMTAKAAVLPHASGRRALLVTELAAPPVAVAGPGERHDLATGVLLSLGLHLLPTPWEPAPPAGGWAVRLPTADAAVVTDPEGGCYYEGGLGQPRKWRQLVARRGTVELLAGVAGMDAAGPGNPEPGLAALEAAAKAGRLVGATVPVLAAEGGAGPVSAGTAALAENPAARRRDRA